MDVEPFLVALAIGLLLGFERERSHIRTLPAGSRSFALLSLTGAVAAGFDIWAVSAGIVVVGLLMALAYLRTSEQDAGTTTEIAALVAYLLGALAYTDPSVAVALAVIVAGLLMSKSRIHRFARQMVSEIELEDAIKSLVAAFVILPLLPDREIGPYGVLNPAKVWLLVVLLTGIGWIGYIGVRTLGPQRGLLVTGLAGGFVSASATTPSMGRLSRTADEMRAPLAGALVASLATFIQLLVVIGFVEPDVLRRLWPPVVAGAMVLVVVAAIVYRGASVAPRDAEVISVGVEPNTAARPFSLRPALVLAAVLVFALFVGRWGADVLVFALFVGRWGADVLGSRGAVLAAAVAGLADAHAGALGAASLAAKGTITVDSALQAIAAALGSNLLVKSVLAFTSGGHRFGLGFLAAMVLPTVVFAVVMTIVVTMG
ncbi:DUF4010 domain-containing protein [Rhodococcus fascians]|jgi:uncharacterized membrane protein (DUF4010 family)|nr:MULTISPECIES: DUF4010 domain-containing protein [Rhodococcus]KJV00348.1 MgtC family protein [Rhodococcus sp. PML026]MDJ0469355.1 DUF4010 domain-containing protein [Rhodococcus fascians]